MNNQIKCSNCSPLTLDEVELTGMGQTELAETHLQDVRVGRLGRGRLSKTRVSLKSSKGREKTILQSNISCPACKNRKISFIERSGTYSIYKCQSCTLEFSHPMKGMSAHEYAASEGYDRLRMLGTNSQESVLWWGHKQFFKDVPKLPAHDHAVKLLDIGCGTGAFVDLALKKGYDSYGIDFDQVSVQVAWRTEKLRGRVFHTDKQETLECFDPLSFGIITFFEVLEHVEDPPLFLSQVQELLAPNGFIALCVPQADRWSLKYHEREAADYPPHHLTRWTGKALKIFIEEAGFDILKFRESPISFGFYWLISNNLEKKTAASGRVNVGRRDFVDSRIVNLLFNFAVKAKQNMLTPFFSIMGLRGDRILVIARKDGRSDGLKR